MIQVDTANLTGVLQALSAVPDAAVFPSAGLKRLTTFVQLWRSNDDDGMDVGAPAPKACTTPSTSIVEVLEDLKNRAKGELSDARRL